MSDTFWRRLVNEYRVLKANFWQFLLLGFYQFYVISVPGKNLVFYLDRPVLDISVRDAMFDILPEVRGINIQDRTLLVFICFTAVLLLGLPFVFPIFHKHRVFVAGNLVILVQLGSALYSLRTVAFLVTLMPDSTYYCRHDEIPRPQNLHGRPHRP